MSDRPIFKSDSGPTMAPDSASDLRAGWDSRLWWMWVLYSALAYLLVFAIVLVLTSLGLDGTRVAGSFELIGTLLMATVGAAIYGAVLGRLQWRVVRQRLPMPRRTWVVACVVPAVVVWAVVVVPAGAGARTSGDDVRLAYLLAVSQALALGPLIGLAQARALRPYTRRWKAWIAANFFSWLLVEAVFFVVSLIVPAFDFAHGKGTPLEALVVLIASAPLSGRWFLWVTAPGALVNGEAPDRRKDGAEAGT